MTLIHDYDGDPNQTYYTSKFLPPGWLPADPTWSVHTAEETYQGTISVTKATTVSDNTVFAQLAADLGWDKLDATAHAMGITSPLDGNPSEVIGGLTDRRDAAGDGRRLRDARQRRLPHRPDDHQQGRVPRRQLDQPRRSRRTSGCSPTARRTPATQVLKTVITERDRHRRQLRLPGGRQDRHRRELDNAWFVGYTPQLSTAVWVGYPQSDNIPMAGGFGGTLAAPIWHDYMARGLERLLRRLPAADARPWHGTAFFGPHSATGSAEHHERRLTASGSGRRRATGHGPNNAVQQPDDAVRAAAAARRHASQRRTGGGGAPRAAAGGRRERPRLAAGTAGGPRRATNAEAPYMPKEEKVELEGEVVEALPNAMFRVKLDNMDRIVLGHVAGKMRRFRIRILPGDRVRVELSPYDLDRARIVYRHR